MSKNPEIKSMRLAKNHMPFISR